MRTTYRAHLHGLGGELDMISADDLETLARHLGKRLINGDWVLSEGDFISITSGQVQGEVTRYSAA